MAMKQGELVPQIFEHEQFGKIRVIGDSANPRFCLSDVCKVLEIGNPSDVKRRLDKGVVSIETLQTTGGMQNLTFVNEDGLYDVVLDSRKPEAKRFRKWITAEVVPSIRKHGVYMTAEAAEKIISNPDFVIGLAQQVKEARAERDAALAQVAELKPKADYTEAVLESDEKLTSELIAKEYGESGQWLNATMGKFGKTFKRGRHIYMKAPYAREGYRVSETVILARGKTVVNHYWTQKGRQFIYYTLKAHGILPLKERNAPMATLI